ncbi:MAG: hypothetical protein SFU98_21765 [Leptospiraceae bacterium]|nr:hypothetical protein [Leptospiraceae bacterium]
MNTILTKSDLEGLSPDFQFRVEKGKIYLCFSEIIGIEELFLNRLDNFFEYKSIVLNSSIIKSVTLPNYCKRFKKDYLKFADSFHEVYANQFIETIPLMWLFAIENEFKLGNSIIITSAGLSTYSINFFLKLLKDKIPHDLNLIVIDFHWDKGIKFIGYEGNEFETYNENSSSSYILTEKKKLSKVIYRNRELGFMRSVSKIFSNLFMIYEIKNIHSANFISQSNNSFVEPR